ncbi:MAG TPA: glycoside hydrolase family protein [Burkholderiaceae bacterium]
MAVADNLRRRSAIVAAVCALAAPAEGIRHYAYYDPPGVLTVCDGHTGNVTAGRYYSDGECYQLLQADAGQAVDTVLRCAPGAPDSVAAAFGDAVFNLGPTIACDVRKSTAARLLAARQWRGACEQLPRWDRATVAGVSVALPGLTKRRQLERGVCLQGLTS